MGLLFSISAADFESEKVELFFLDEESTDNHDRSDAPIMVFNHQKVAVAFWAAGPICSAATSLLWFSKSLPTKRRDAVSRCILLINASNYSAWNIRFDFSIPPLNRRETDWRKRMGLISKHLIQQNQIPVDEERRFIDLVLSKHLKSAETWSHRSWLLKHSQSASYQQRIAELQVITQCVSRYPKNYYAWNFRLLLDLYHSKTEDNERSIADKELTDLEEFLRKHPSDHSCLHLRGQLLLIWTLSTLDEGKPSAMLFGWSTIKPKLEQVIKQEEGDGDTERLFRRWLAEFFSISSVDSMYPGHLSLWYHRRFLFSCWTLLVWKFIERSMEPRGVTISATHCAETSLDFLLQLKKSLLMPSPSDEEEAIGSGEESEDDMEAHRWPTFSGEVLIAQQEVATGRRLLSLRCDRISIGLFQLLWIVRLHLVFHSKIQTLKNSLSGASLGKLVSLMGWLDILHLKQLYDDATQELSSLGFNFVPQYSLFTPEQGLEK